MLSISDRDSVLIALEGALVASLTFLSFCRPIFFTGDEDDADADASGESDGGD